MNFEEAAAILSAPFAELGAVQEAEDKVRAALSENQKRLYRGLPVSEQPAFLVAFARKQAEAEAETESAAQFEAFKTQARELSADELRRHASVSLNNEHYCRSCFTCACVSVLRAQFSAPGAPQALAGPDMLRFFGVRYTTDLHKVLGPYFVSVARANRIGEVRGYFTSAKAHQWEGETSTLTLLGSKGAVTMSLPSLRLCSANLVTSWQPAEADEAEAPSTCAYCHEVLSAQETQSGAEVCARPECQAEAQEEADFLTDQERSARADGIGGNPAELD